MWTTFPSATIGDRAGAVAVAAVPLLALPGLIDFADLPQRLALALLAPIAFIVPRLLWRDLALLALLAWAAVSVTWSSGPHEGISRIVLWTAGAALYFAVSRSDPGLWRRPLAASAVAVALIGLAQFAGLDWPSQPVAYGSTLANPNMAAAYVAVLAPFGLYLGVRERLAMWAAIAAYLWIAGFLTAWVALGCAVWITCYVRMAQRARLATLFITGVLAACVLLGPGSSSIDTRLALSLNTAAMVPDHPLGLGIGGWAPTYPLYANAILPDYWQSLVSSSARAHNDWIQWAAEAGWIGVILLAGVVAAFLAARPSGPAALSLVVLAVVALGSFPMSRAATVLAGAAALGLAVPGPRARRPGFQVKLVSTALLGVGIGWFSLLVLGDLAHRRSYDALVAHDAFGAGENAARAIRLMPLDAEPVEKLGVAFLLLDRPEESAAAFRAALLRRPNQPRVLWHLASAEATAGNYDAARRAIIEARRLLPRSPPIVDMARRFGG